MRYIIERTRDVGKKEQSTSQTVRTIAYEGDRSAHEWRVTITSDGAPVTLAGYEIAAYFKLPDTQGEAIRVQGVLSGSVASVVLAPECYAKAGRVQARMIASSADRQLTIDAIALDVEDFAVSAVVDLTGTLLDTEEMIAAISAMKAATADARAVVDTSCPAIVPTQAGEVIALSDSADRPIRELTIYGRTTQDGTPSQEAPVKLESVGAAGKVEMRICGANLLDIAQLEGSTTADVSVSGAEMTLTAKSEGTYRQTKRIKILTASCPVTVQASWALVSRSNAEHMPVCTGYWYKDGVQLKSESFMVWPTTSVSKTVTPPAAGAELHIIFALNERTAAVVGDTCTLKNILFNVGAQMPYEAHKKQTATITTANGLPGVPVTGSGNYTDVNGQQWIADTLEYDAEQGRGERVRRIEPIDFDGSEDYQALNGYFRVLYPGLQAGGSGLCTIGPVYNAFSQNGFYYNATYIYFRFDDAGINSEKMTVAEVKAWIAENPFTLYAILAEPIKTALSADDLASFAALRTHYPNTTIYNSDGAHMSVAYVADTKNYIDQKIAAIAAATIGG